MPRVQAHRTGTAALLPTTWPWLVRGFRKYVRRYFAKHFHAVRIAKTGRPPRVLDRPTIMVMNHPSWWDALIGFLICPLWPDRLDFGPMDAHQLNRYRIFAKIGMFGIEQDSIAGARTFLKVSRAILTHENATLWITAQGSFADVRTRPVRLRPGVGHLAAGLDCGAVIPIALEYPFWDESKPEALVLFGESLMIDDHKLDAESWTQLIAEALEQAQDRLAVEAQSRDPQRFDTLVAGRVGVGGIYDFGRRMKAMLTGRRFDPAHKFRSDDA
jgi:1-acyl-sn-glycerol-3-phosphate acyltransferase